VLATADTAAETTRTAANWENRRLDCIAFVEFPTLAQRGRPHVPIADSEKMTEISGDMIRRYDRGAQTLGDLDYESSPDITRAVPELVEVLGRLPTRLPKTPTGGGQTQATQKRKVTQLRMLQMQSGREDLNLRLLGPEPSALPGCATPRGSADARSRYGERAWRGRLLWRS
jgi:hypothetical protein